MKFITILLTTCMVTKLAFSANQSTVSIVCCRFHDFPLVVRAIFITCGFINALIRMRLIMILFPRCNFVILPPSSVRNTYFQHLLGCVSRNIRIHLYGFDAVFINSGVVNVQSRQNNYPESRGFSIVELSLTKTKQSIGKHVNRYQKLIFKLDRDIPITERQYL